MNIRIKNAVGTADLESPIGDCWLDYWAELIEFVWEGNTDYQCPVCGQYFPRKKFDGAHVQKVFDITGKLYIVPLCDSCSHVDSVLSVDENLLISAPLK